MAAKSFFMVGWRRHLSQPINLSTYGRRRWVSDQQNISGIGSPDLLRIGRAMERSTAWTEYDSGSARPTAAGEVPMRIAGEVCRCKDAPALAVDL